MSFDVLSFYEAKKGTIDLVVQEDRLPLFILFFVGRYGSMNIQELRKHTKVPMERVDQVIARLVGNNLLSLAEDHVSTTDEGKDILRVLGLLEERHYAKDFVPSPAVVKVVGIGGGGCNIVHSLMQEGLKGIQVVAVNTDTHGLESIAAHSHVLIGKKLTRGLGASGDPDLGKLAAEESKDKLLELVKGTHVLFIVAAMGGGTGTGAAPLVAKLAREAGAITIAVVTRPFVFEGERREKVAEEGITLLTKIADSIFVIDNNELLHEIEPNVTVETAFKLIDSKLIDLVKQVTVTIGQLITVPGLINLDFDDVKSILSDAGTLHVGMGRATGEHSAVSAAKTAIASMLPSVCLDRATGIVFNVSGGKDLTLFEVNAAAEIIAKAAGRDAQIIFGVEHEPKLGNSVQVILVATGIWKEAAIRETGLDVLSSGMPERRIVARVK